MFKSGNVVDFAPVASMLGLYCSISAQIHIKHEKGAAERSGGPCGLRGSAVR